MQNVQSTQTAQYTQKMQQVQNTQNAQNNAFNAATSPPPYALPGCSQAGKRRNKRNSHNGYSPLNKEERERDTEKSSSGKNTTFKEPI